MLKRFSKGRLSLYTSGPRVRAFFAQISKQLSFLVGGAVPLSATSQLTETEAEECAAERKTARQAFRILPVTYLRSFPTQYPYELTEALCQLRLVVVSGFS